MLYWEEYSVLESLLEKEQSQAVRKLTSFLWCKMWRGCENAQSTTLYGVSSQSPLVEWIRCHGILPPCLYDASLPSGYLQQMFSRPSLASRTVLIFLSSDKFWHLKVSRPNLSWLHTALLLLPELHKFSRVCMEDREHIVGVFTIFSPYSWLKGLQGTSVFIKGLTTECANEAGSLFEGSSLPTLFIFIFLIEV